MGRKHKRCQALNIEYGGRQGKQCRFEVDDHETMCVRHARLAAQGRIKTIPQLAVF